MSIAEILKVIVIGIIEGFTEWMPVSSTGHMILIDEIIRLDVTPEFRSVFLVVIQMGAVMAVLVQYYRTLNPFYRRKKPEQKAATWRLWAKIVIACIPAGILGLLLDDWVDAHLYNGFVIGGALIFYGIVFLVIENINRRRRPVITRLGRLGFQTAFYIGLFQILAFVPGTSRSGATILGAMILGCARPVAVEFSFFLGIPVILGAGLLKIVKFTGPFTGTEVVYLLVGVVTAFLVSMYSIKLFITWIKKNDFRLFGCYRIILGVIVLIWFGLKALLG